MFVLQSFFLHESRARWGGSALGRRLQFHAEGGGPPTTDAVAIGYTEDHVSVARSFFRSPRAEVHSGTIASTGIAASKKPWPVTDGSHVLYQIKPTCFLLC